jgi:hypothetical protein
MVRVHHYLPTAGNPIQTGESGKVSSTRNSPPHGVKAKPKKFIDKTGRGRKKSKKKRE